MEQTLGHAGPAVVSGFSRTYLFRFFEKNGSTFCSMRSIDAIGVIAVVGLEGVRDAEVREDLIHLPVRSGQSVLRADLAHDRVVLLQVGDVLVDHRQR